MHHAAGRLAARTLALALVLAMVVPASAAAFDFTAPPSAGPINATLPLLGSSLTVDVATDDNGHLTSVALDPTGDFTATVDRPHAVRFETADGSVKVTITSWGGHTTLAAKTKTLADLEGAGTWKADLFNTGDPTTVKYTIGHDGAGAPTIVVDDVAGPAAIVATVGTPTTKTSDHRASARVGIDFAWNGFTKKLTIGVSTVTKDDKTSAKLQVSLSGRSKQQVSGALADVLGAHAWSGKLCDGTAIGIAFQVVEDPAGTGKVTFDPDTFATGAEARAKELRKGKGFVAIFKEQRAAVLVWLKKSDDDTWKLVVGSFAGKWCKGTTIANPTVNTPVSADATTGKDGKFHWGFWGWGRHGFGNGWGHNNGHGDRSNDRDGGYRWDKNGGEH
jgi:hypothetical protein